MEQRRCVREGRIGSARVRRIAANCPAVPGGPARQPHVTTHSAGARGISAAGATRLYPLAGPNSLLRAGRADDAANSGRPCAQALHAAKRGGNAVTVALEEDSSVAQKSLDLVALDDAMKRLADLDPRQCQIVELRFFGGLSIEETAEAVKISPATTKREWATARLWLHHAMTNGAEL